MSDNKQLVHRFYEQIWDAHDASAIPQVLHEDFAFRGSLGQELRGHDGFSGYVSNVWIKEDGRWLLLSADISSTARSD